MNNLKFIEKARKIHGDKYDYSKVEYVSYRTKVCIICPKHGEFWQTPAQHLGGKNCRACAAEKVWEGKKITTDTFIEKAKEIHGDKYDYSKVEYINGNTKVCIICPKHGEFWQTPKCHLLGYGCKKCSHETTNTERELLKNNFIKKAKEVHGDKYDYSKVEYINGNTKVCIICPKHGEFWQTPNGHSVGYGCQKCYDEKRGEKLRWTNDIYAKKIIDKYGDKYDLANLKYINSKTPIKITCKKHGLIEDNPLHFLKYGCPKCHTEDIVLNRALKKEKAAIEKEKATIEKEENKKRSKLEKFFSYMKKFKEKHGDKYDYSKIETIKNSNDKVCIICPEHGEFWQTAKNHANGSECPKCSIERIKKSLTMSKEDFIEKARKVHGDKYDYSKVEYVKNNTKVCIICPKHGEFWQTPAMHTSEHQGCPECGTLSSFGENEIYNFLKNDLGINDIIKREKTILKPKELDIFIKSHQLAIEYDGLRWHSEKFGKDSNYHLNKTLECEKKQINLIHIFEDEWEYKKEIVKHKLKHILKYDTKLQKIHARKCIIKEIDKNTCDAFFEKFHIQGKTLTSIRLGAFYDNKLIGVMSFLRKATDGEYVLNRFSTDYNYLINGIGGKLLKFFIRNYQPSKIITFADRRWTLSKTDNLYTKIGFKLDSIIKPNYYYVTERDSLKKRYHKFNFRKQILHKKYGFDLSMTENEMASKLKAYKIWDCGLYKYVWEKE